MHISTILPLLAILPAILASPSRESLPPPAKRHSYSQYLAAGRPVEPPEIPRYGFEDAVRALQYDERDPVGVKSLTWLEEMAAMANKPSDAPCEQT